MGKSVVVSSAVVVEIVVAGAAVGCGCCDLAGGLGY